MTSQSFRAAMALVGQDPEALRERLGVPELAKLPKPVSVERASWLPPPPAPEQGSTYPTAPSPGSSYPVGSGSSYPTKPLEGRAEGCTNPAIRVEWRNMKDADKKSFVNSVRCL